MASPAQLIANKQNAQLSIGGLVEATVMPPHLERELASHRRRDPLFDPRMDASQMSKALRKWFENHPQAA